MGNISKETNVSDEEIYFRDYLKNSVASCKFLDNPKIIEIPCLDKQKIKYTFGENADNVETIIFPIIKDYLQKSIIIDSFKDHHNRRDWRTSLPADIKKYYKNNKIRGNSITCALAAISFLVEFSLDEKLKKQIEEIYKCLIINPIDPKKRFEYDDLKLNEKIRFSKKLDNAALKILEMFY